MGKNYPAPDKVFDNYGADALRIYLCSSPVVHAEKLKFSEEGVQQICTSVLSPWYNAYNFLIENISRLERASGTPFSFSFSSSSSEVEAEEKCERAEEGNIMDRWIVSELQSLVKFFRAEMEAYRLYTVLPRLLTFIDLLCNTYVRMNRTRLRGQQGEAEARSSTRALFCVLLTLCQV